MTRTPRIAIVGTGMAGLGAAHRLKETGLPAVLFDKNPYPGGHTASHASEGFVFDEGPHVSFTSDERFRALLSQSVGGDYLQVDAQINNYWQGYWIRHPAITNLHGLPSDLVVRILQDFIASQNNPQPVINNYMDWLVASYGRTFAENFPARYTVKYHTTTAENLTTDWLGPRLYRASLEEVLRGAVAPGSPNIHYVQDYRYPAQGGFASYLELFRRQSDIRLSHEVVQIDWRRRELRFSNGSVAEYDHLISSVPLPDLIGMIPGTPPDVRAAAEQLACTTLVLVNLGVARSDVSSHSWNYYYDEEFPFSRVSYPRVMSPNVVPEGMSSIQAEVYFSRKYRPLTGAPEAWIDPVIDGLRRSGVLRQDDRITFRQALLVPYANIIFDLDREASLRSVHGYLDSIGVRYCGRYGDWGYLWTDEAFRSGENAAQGIVDRLDTPTSLSTTAA
jgi:protoporphyrinogen oxidase